MSVVLVCLPGAPKISEEAVKKEEELDKYLEARVEGQRTAASTYTPLLASRRLTRFPFLFFPRFPELLANCGEAGTPDLVSVLRSIATENIPNLPPGGGLASK